jgi:hypothetical protein
MPNHLIYIFDLGGVLIRLDVGRCMRAFEALMDEENMRACQAILDSYIREFEWRKICGEE